MRNKAKRCIALILCALFVLLSGCEGGLPWNRSPYERLSDGEEEPSPSPTPTQIVMEMVTDNRFTLKYDPEEDLNPLRCTGTYNIAVGELMYERLYTVDGDFQAVPVLCESMTTEDGVVWTVKVKQGIMMHDGKPLTAYDVAYSINEARNSEKYISRLTGIQEFSVLDDSTIYMALWDADYAIASVLDVPVIREGTIDEPVPAGSGPYTFSRRIGGGKLTAFQKHRNASELPLQEIYLSEVEFEQLTLAFTNSEVDMMQFDPTGHNIYNIRVDTERHYYDTTVLQYIGFNHYGDVTQDYRFRQAVYYAVNREKIVDTVMNGAAVEAPLILSPELPEYSWTWEPKEDYSVTKLCEILADMGFADRNADGYLEYPTTGGMLAFTLEFLVNEENPYKVAAAEEIADTLRSIGINVDLQKLDWETFSNRVAWGEFDMFYGEVRLGANFDLRDLTTRYGALNFGGQLGVSDAALAQLDTDPSRLEDEEYLDSLDVPFYSGTIRRYMGAQGEERAAAAENLCRYFLEDSYVVPVLYKKYAVMVHRDVITGMKPTASSVFYNIDQWTITLKQEEQP
ncbi:MAG: ABC transporter substrate-binding protein [Oscillospiraceae bacterium]|nr:ABC transporter substrate-binding protein [Oscillospiraceae bacterium]